MDDTGSSQPLDPPREARRRFLKQIATTGVIAGAGALPAWAQEKPQSSSPPSSSPASPPPAVRAAPGGPTIAETLARYATSLRYEDLPPDVVRMAKRYLIDTIGCAIGGYSAEPSQIAIKLAAGVSAPARRHRDVQRHQDQPRSRGVRQRRDDPLSRFQRRLYRASAADIRATPSRRCLSTADMMGRSGRDLITGTVLAYEVFCKVCDVFDNRAVGLDYVDGGRLRRGRRRGPPDGSHPAADRARDSASTSSAM